MSPLANVKESFTVYLLIVSEHKIDTKKLYGGEVIASSIGLKDEQLLMIGNVP